MGQQPLVAGGHPCIFFALRLEDRLLRVRTLRQDDGDAEAGLLRLARRVVERRAVDLDRRARRDAEGFDLRGVKPAVLDLVFLCQQQHEIRLAGVDLAVAMIFEAVQLCVVAPAHPDLDGHPAVGSILHGIKDTAFLQCGNRRLIGRAALRHGDSLHRRDQRSRVKAGQNLAVGLECGVGNRVNFHNSSCYRKSQL